MNNHFCYIDAENRTDITYLKKYSNVTYYVFLGKNQKDKIKYDSGTKVKKIRCEKQGKQYLDCKLIDFVLSRKNTKNTIHDIVSNDNGYDKFIDYLNTLNGQISYRITDFDNY